jgi:hypothetical protein
MTLPFANTQTLQSVSVTTVDDTAVESAENFTMNLSSPTGGAAIGTGAATGTINDNDSAPTLSISDAEGTEGGTLTFIVTKTGSASATVNYATSNGSAVAPGDYGAASGTLNFAATDATKTITIGLGGGTQVEADESFTITLSGASGATITDAQGVGTISDDDEGCPTC